MTQQEHGSVAMGDSDIAAIIENTRAIVGRAALTGFNCHDGDWVEELFVNNGKLTEALEALSTRPAQEPVAFPEPAELLALYYTFDNLGMRYFDYACEVLRRYGNAPQPAHGTSATEREPEDHVVGVNEKAIKAICAAVVLGEDEQVNPVHLSAEEARKAIGAYQSVQSPSSAPSLLEWQDVEALQRIAGEIQALKLHPATGEEYDAGYIAARNDAFAIVQEVIDNAQ